MNFQKTLKITRWIFRLFSLSYWITGIMLVFCIPTLLIITPYFERILGPFKNEVNGLGRVIELTRSFVNWEFILLGLLTFLVLILTGWIFHQFARLTLSLEVGEILGAGKRIRKCIVVILSLVGIGLVTVPLASRMNDKVKSITQNPEIVEFAKQSKNPEIWKPDCDKPWNNFDFLITPQFGGITGIILSLFLYLLAQYIDEVNRLRKETELTI